LQDWGPFGHFSYQLGAFEATIRAGQTVYPVERTLLTTGILDRCMHGLAGGGISEQTPELAIRCSAAPWPFANHPQSKLQLPLAGLFSPRVKRIPNSLKGHSRTRHSPSVAH